MNPTGLFVVRSVHFACAICLSDSPRRDERAVIHAPRHCHVQVGPRILKNIKIFKKSKKPIALRKKVISAVVQVIRQNLCSL